MTYDPETRAYLVPDPLRDDLPMGERPLVSFHFRDTAGPPPITLGGLATTLDHLLKQMQDTEGLAEDSASAVITFALAAMGLAKLRTLILQAQEVSLEAGQEGETHFAIGLNANYPGCQDAPEFCRQLELSFADFLTRRNTPDAPPEIATP